MLMHILFLGSQPPADMPLRFIYIQNLSRLLRKTGIDLDQSVSNILMYRRFADSKRLRRLPDRGVAVNDIIGDADGTLLNIILQKSTP